MKPLVVLVLVTVQLALWVRWGARQAWFGAWWLGLLLVDVYGAFRLIRAERMRSDLRHITRF